MKTDSFDPLRGVAADLNRPGQRLLPIYAVKLLRYLKIDFGTDKRHGIDVDPTLGLYHLTFGLNRFTLVDT
jgi:hypothetical protein